MRVVAVREAKRRLCRLLAEVERGGQFVITRRGVPVARLVGAVPVVTCRSRCSAQCQRVTRAMAALAELHQGIARFNRH